MTPPTPRIARLRPCHVAFGRTALVAAVSIIVSCLAGCAGDMQIIDSDPAKAEALLREALAADVYHGPSHNDLGVVYLKQGKLYEAANEFEWARKLMPGHPDPRMNLALTLERAGRVDEAIATYDTALEVYPNHLPTMQALTRLQIRRSRTDERTAGMLKEIALSGETPQWRKWAQRSLVGSGAPTR
jgi:Flp pilus assembly protein TadD